MTFPNVIEVAALVVAGTMVGNELAVALFVHPSISRLDDPAHSQAAKGLAHVLGAAMPFWYVLTLILNLLVVFVARVKWSTPWWLAVASAAIFAAIIIYTLIAPAPLNSRIAHWDLNALPSDWKQMRRRWDLMHAIRCVFLVAALVLLVVSLVI